MVTWARKPHNHVIKIVFQRLDSSSAKELERGLPTGSWLWYQLFMPPIQSYTNHTRKRVRSRSGTHGKISQHNSRHKLKWIKPYITSQGPRWLEYISSNRQESAEATISDYKTKLDKFALRRLAQTSTWIEKARPPAWEPPNYSWSSAAST